MRHSSLSLLLVAVVTLGGCSMMHPGVDQLDAMVPATEDPVASVNPLDQEMQEPAPEALPYSGNSLWLRIVNGFALDDYADNARVDAQRVWFANHQAYLDRVTSRAQRYLHYIADETEKRNMPMELALLPVVESAFDPFAYSRSHASGPWQFIPSTGRHFNLTQDWWYDGRRDIVDSTQAALNYLQQLADRFNGDWLLALASYNAGAGTVSRAIERNRAQGLPTDFWSLTLPRETRDYVPKLIAVAQLVSNPAKYGITLPDIANEPYFDVVDTGGQLDLSQAAKMADIPVEELYMLNPGFNRWATSPNGPDRLLIPLKHVEDFVASLDQLPPDQRVTWTRYVIRNGDNLLSISRHKGVPVETLRSVNHIKGNNIVAGKTLLIPGGNGSAESYASALGKTLRSHNQPASFAGGSQRTYVVRSGDTLWGIARRHRVAQKDLLAWNNMTSGSTLRPGQKLKLQGSSTAFAPVPSSTRGDDSTRQVRYSVRNGDSLYAIASKFNVSVASIERWNSISSSRSIQPGQHLTLYVDVRNTD